MAESVFTKRYHEWLPPTTGQPAVYAGTTTAASVDLTTVGTTVLSMANADNYPSSLAYSGATGQSVAAGATLTTGKGCMDGFVTIAADPGADWGIIFGATAGAVGGTWAPSLGATGVGASGGCLRIFAGQPPQRYYIHPAARWMGFVGTTGGTGALRVCPSSRSGG